MSRRYGYARVSTDDQSLDIQRAALKAAGCEIIREEKASGASREGRDQLSILLDFVGEGDVLVVTKLDRLARSVRDLMDIHDRIQEKGAALCILNMNLDTTTSTGKLMLGVLGCVAEFERDLIRERQREGIEAAKQRGVFKGGKRKFDPAEIRKLKDEGLSPTEIKDRIGAKTTMTVYRALSHASPQ